MKYNFDEIIDRHSTLSYKWDSADDKEVIPLWVADMDFKTAPAIIEALKKRVVQGIFGYTKVPDEYYDAVINWFSRRHGFEINRDWMIYTSGVVPAISAIIKALTSPGDKVLVQTPVYNCFFSSIRNNGCEVWENPLINDNGYFRIDFEDLEKKAAAPDCKLMLLCNPHNPTGRVWSKEELERIGDICYRNGIIIVSDEIHCELTFPDFKYTPFGSLDNKLSENAVICVSPSKAFNIAGLQIANIICKKDNWRQKIDKAININEVCDVNPFGVIATIEAYERGEEWLESLRRYLKDNYDFLVRFFKENMPSLNVTESEGTYLAWIDTKPIYMDSEELEELLMKKYKVWVNAGRMYGEKGEGFIRINFACPRKRLESGLLKIKEAYDIIKSR